MSKSAGAASGGGGDWERPDSSVAKAGYAGKASKAAHDAGAPPAIEFPCSVFDLDFHPKQDVVCAGLVSGDVNLFQYRSGSDAAVRRVASIHVSERACRKVQFTSDGGALLCATADGAVSLIDASGKQIWKDDKEHKGSPVNTTLEFSGRILASGDDDGRVLIWDLRSRKPAFRFADGSPHNDIIMNFALREDKATLVSCSGDGTVSAIDLRKGKVLAQSDNQETALLSVALVRGGSKVVVGTQDGPLHMFSWGRFADMDDRLVGHEGSVDCMLPADGKGKGTGPGAGLLFTGGEDGLVRLVGVYPHRMVKVVGEHGDEPVQAMQLSRCGQLLGSCALDDMLRFWDVREALKGEEDEDTGKDEAEPVASSSIGTPGGAGSTSSAARSVGWNPAEARRTMDTSEFYSDLGAEEDT